MKRFIPFLLFPLALLGCDSGSGITACTTEIQPGLVVEVKDADTGAYIAEGALGIARDRSYVDTLREGRWGSDGVVQTLKGAYERGGTYEITISKPGYRTWQRDGVRVTEAECGVRTVELEALLERE